MLKRQVTEVKRSRGCMPSAQDFGSHGGAKYTGGDISNERRLWPVGCSPLQAGPPSSQQKSTQLTDSCAQNSSFSLYPSPGLVPGAAGGALALRSGRPSPTRVHRAYECDRCGCGAPCDPAKFALVLLPFSADIKTDLGLVEAGVHEEPANASEWRRANLPGVTTVRYCRSSRRTSRRCLAVVRGCG